MPRLLKSSFSIVAQTKNMLDVIEDAARKCYLSEPKTQLPVIPMPIHLEARKQEQIAFLTDKIKLGHHSVLEHGNITVDFVFDRGVSHEEVRHRLQAISQESTRYCNYSKEKFDEQIAVIEPCFWKGEDDWRKYDIWLKAMTAAEQAYLDLIALGATAQEARSVLPNSLKTEMRVTANVREWRHILKIRTEKGVHPQMAEVMVPTLIEFKKRWPVLFADINHDPKWDHFLEGSHAAV